MEVEIGRREFLRYGFGLFVLTLLALFLPGCRNILEQFEKDKKQHPAGTPLGELVRKGYVVSKANKSDWQTTWLTTFGGTKVVSINGRSVATYDVIDAYGYVDPTVGAGEYQLGTWKTMTWYDFNRQPVLTVAA